MANCGPTCIVLAFIAGCMMKLRRERMEAIKARFSTISLCRPSLDLEIIHNLRRRGDVFQLI